MPDDDVNENDVYEIEGQIVGPAARPLDGARVVVWWQHIRERRELASGHSSDDGRYRIRYRVPEDTASPVLLVVGAFSEDLPVPLTSDLLQAQPTLQVDLRFEPADQSQWANLIRRIEPLLDGLSLTDLVEDSSHQDISFLAQELGRDTETIMRVAIAARFGAIFDIPAPACYAFLAQHVPAGLPSPLLEASQNFTLIGPLIQRIGSLIFALSPGTQTTTLTAAVALDLIGSQYTNDIATWVEQLQKLRSNDLLNQPYTVGNTTLAQLLDTAALPAAQQQAFARTLASSTQSMRNFWRTLGDGSHGLSAEEASTVERTLSLGAFVKNHVPLVQVLLQGFATGAYTSLPDLAQITLPQWTQMVQQTGAPPGVNSAGSASTAEVFASVVYTRVTRAYPTAALASRITTGGLVAPGLQNDLSRFFQNNSSLELLKDSLPAYLEAKGANAWTGIDSSRQASVVAGTRRLQRVLRVASKVDVAETLLKLGIGSATEIANLGEQRFFMRATAAGLTKPEANNVYKVAASRYAQLVALYLRFNSDSVNLLPHALGQLTELTGLGQQAVDRDQSLATLFGSQDNCATDDCTSILSPAAYLCDLLLWLRNHQQVGYTVLDVLDARRPDIRHLLLNCPNTDTELPYIDLVNELLADKISPPVDTVATSFVQRALQDGTTYYYVVTAVNAKGESAASAQVSVTPEAPAGVPATPTGLMATAGDARVTLTWNPVSGAASYNLYWSTSPGLTPSTGTRIAGVTDRYNQTGLTNGTPYYYIVTGVNADGEGTPSGEVTAIPAMPVAVPPTPGALTTFAGDGEVTISWTELAEAESYNLYWSNTPGVTPATGARIPGVTSPYVQTERTDGTQVYYVLTALNAAGESAPSAEASAIPTAPLTVPAAPVSVVATAGDGQVTIGWDPVAGATSYNIYWSTTPGVTVANGTAITGDRNPRWKQTSPGKAAAELAAAPEYFNQGAYSTLFGASYPMSLPFSAGLDDLRTYLQHWQVPLWQLRQAVLPVSAPTLAERSAVAAERFHIPPHGHDLIVNANFVPASVAWNTADPAADLVPVDAFGQAASITFEQLRELLEATWVQGGINLSIEGINDACLTSQESLAPAPLDAGFLDRAHRFLRLWNATNYAMWELNQLMQAPSVANGTLDDNALVAMASFRQLQDVTGLPVDEQLALCQDIDTASHRDPGGTTAPLYDRLFLNPTVTAIAPDPDLDVLPVGGTIADPALSDHQSAIQAALGLSAPDTATLIGLTDNQLNLSNLSFLYRVSALSIVAKIGVTGLIELAQLLSPGSIAAAAITPLFSSPDATLTFLANAKAAHQPGLSLDALQYVLTPPVATTLSASITASATTITVASDADFPAPDFSIAIGAEILQVTAIGGAGNATWTVARGQQGTVAAAAATGSAVSLTGGWATSTQMTPVNIASALTAIQQAVQGLATTLTAPITVSATTITVASSAQDPPPNFFVSINAEILLVTAVAGPNNTTWTVLRGQQGTAAAAAPGGSTVMPAAGGTTLVAALDTNSTTLTVASDTGFPPAPFYVSIGSEIVQVTAISGAGNATWTVVRGQQNTSAQAAPAGAYVTTTGANINGTVISTVAADAHTPSGTGLASDVTAVVLSGITLPGSTRTLLAVLADPAFTASAGAVTAANYPDQFLAVQLFDKVATVVRGVRLVASDLSWLLANAANSGTVDLTQLPVIASQAPIGLKTLLTTLLLIQLSRSWTAAPPTSTIRTLYDVIAGVASGSMGSVTSAQAALATVTGWPLLNIQAFSSQLGLTFPADYTQPASYDALRKLEAMATATGASGPQLVVWGTVPQDEPTAEAIAAGTLGVLKAQQSSTSAWLSLAPSLMNPIRDRRAAALQAYLIGQKDSSGQLIYQDANGLFDYFLIDTQMTSCQVTSRVVQAYIAVQTFVERCLMNLEAPAVVVDPADPTWQEWDWRSRYRIWEANREVFLYPENWLIESQRKNRTEIFQKLEQEVRQSPATADYLEEVVLDYIDRLDVMAHLLVTGTCRDPKTGDIHVVARTLADPPQFYWRSYVNGAWNGWAQIPLDIKAHQAVPALYRGRVCLFWAQVSVSNEPQQALPAAQASSAPPSQDTDRYVALGVNFSTFRNGAWSPVQAAKGKLFDKPVPLFGDLTPPPRSAGDSRSIEALYTVKVQAPTPAPGLGASLFVDVFRIGALQTHSTFGVNVVDSVDPTVAVHIGRAVFDGRFNDLELRNVLVQDRFLDFFGIEVPLADGLLQHAQTAYGPDAKPLLPLPDDEADPNLVSDSGLLPEAGALASAPADATQGSTQTFALDFTSAGALDNNVGPLLNTAHLPARVVGPVTDLSFDPSSYFFFQDNQRSYWVESQKLYWTGSAWAPVVPSSPASAPYEVRYWFHVFYHPFTRLFWNQLAGGGFDLLYDPNLQQNPDQIDPAGSDVFSFASNYSPTWRVRWDHDDVTGADRQFLDFNRGASFAVYNWELFYHVPLYIAQLLSQNQQFEDARRWFHYIFNPTRQSGDPVPQRFWIPKPLHNLTSAQTLGEQVNLLLQAVNQGNAEALQQVADWQADPFDPFLLADLRLGVPYMKYTVMSYLDNLIAWGDNLFATQSREALSEATLLYVMASEILGPTPVTVTPPAHADESFDQLEPALDAFANALVEIENAIGGAGGSGSSGAGGVPAPQTFYFKIPANQKLLGYWSTVADRLYEMRHCETIAGAPLQLALFDAPIDPGLLIAAQAAGVDLSSVLSNVFAPLPAYRFTSLYPVALDFVNAVRAYGASLQAALEKTDAGALTLLQQTTQQQLLIDGNDILDWQVQQAQEQLDNLQQALALAQSRQSFYGSQSFTNAWEDIGVGLDSAMILLYTYAAVAEGISAVAHILPTFVFGAAGFGGSPTANAGDGGPNVGHATAHGADAGKATASAVDRASKLAYQIGNFQHRKDGWDQSKREADIQVAQTTSQIAAAQLALQIAQQNQILHQEQVDNIQKQIDFLNTKFTSDSLYDWMVAALSATYFQSYQLAYQMCRQVERCYQFELGQQNTSFIQFGYWDSLHKGLLAGETLSHDLRRMESSYFQQNVRRFELSRFVSMGTLDPGALQQLLVTGSCDFTLPESLYDNDYPGHYNRRLTRVSATVVYPNPGKFDNVKATLTLTANQVRVSTDTTSGYVENPAGSDSRFVYDYAAVPQQIVLGNAQDDPGLFENQIHYQITDPRYLPFENAGAISSWHFELPVKTNEIDLSTVGDVVLHLYYTALDGGEPFRQDVEAYNDSMVPTSGVKIFSAQNDFPAPAPSNANPYPVTPWQAFLAPAVASANQTLTVTINPTKFPAWTRGKIISVTSLTVIVVNWAPGQSFALAPQAPLPTAPVALTPVAGATEPNVSAGTISLPANTPPGQWSFELQKHGAADFRSLTRNDIGDVLFVLNYQASS